MVQIRLKELREATATPWRWLRSMWFLRRDVRDLARVVDELTDCQQTVLAEQHRLQMALETLQKQHDVASLELTRNKSAAAKLFQAVVLRTGFDNETEAKAVINLKKHRQ